MLGKHRQRSVLAMLIACAIGCSQEDVNKLVDQGKDAVNQGTQAVSQTVDQAKSQVASTTAQAQETLQMSGKMELVADAPIQTSAGYATLIPARGERPAVLQIQSCRDAKSESFPSVLIRAIVTAEKPSDLVGQTVDAQVFGQSQAGGPVWHTGNDALAKLKILSVDDKQLQATFESGDLQKSDGPTVAKLSGSITAVWPKQ